MKDARLIFIVGPTAVGKSEIALYVAKQLNAEIVSCDALQVYKEIAVASDKPSLQVRAAVAHHLIDVVSVTEDFNVARWRQLASAAVEDIQSRGKTPLIAGGSGMYMAVLLDGIFEEIEIEETIRKELDLGLLIHGPGVLHQRLQTLDPKAAAKIHPHDSRRVMRALGVTLAAGQPISDLQSQRDGLWDKMPIKIFALNRPREELYQRVEARVEEMFKKGLVEEVKKILSLPLSRTAQKIIGIPEVSGYLKGEYDLERAQYLMKLNTRHYVKRQLSWFKRDKRLTWIDIAPGQTASQVTEIILSMFSDNTRMA